MNDASATRAFELGPVSRAEIAEEALRKIADGDVPSHYADVEEFAQQELSRLFEAK